MIRLSILASLVILSAGQHNTSCAVSGGGWAAVVGTYSVASCELGSAAGQLQMAPCPRCEHGCVRCLDGNIVGLTWQCKPNARDGDSISLVGNTERMIVQYTAVATMFTHCSVVPTA